MATINKGTFNIQLQGPAAINRDATVRLVNQSTGAVVERKPFLDGSLTVRDLDPGIYDMEVRHPNLINPIDRRPVRLFPQLRPTYIPVPIRPEVFKDTPIRDVPDADLTPVQQSAAAVRAQLAPIGHKGSGEVIRSSDWNTLVSALSDLAGAVGELTQLLSPRGHDHAEIAEKIGEVQENMRRFTESFGRSLIELRREIETENLQRTVNEALDRGGADESVRTRVLARVKTLRENIQSDTPTFTRNLAAAGAVLSNEINTIAAARGEDAEAFTRNDAVTRLRDMAQIYAETGTQTRPDAELKTYARTTIANNGQKLRALVKQQA